MKIISWSLAIFILVTAQGTVNAQTNMKWSADGKAYFTKEKEVIVRYELTLFTRTAVISPEQLTPAGKDKPLFVREFSFSDDGINMLIYTCFIGLFQAIS